jgi:ketosteroid isomerase-like protein
MSAVDITLALHRALEAGVHGDELAAHWTDDVRTTEYPNLISPTGRTSSRSAMIAASTRGSGLLSSQRYDVVDVFEHGDTAILRLTWTGVIAADAGPFRAGQELTAHIAQFVTTQAGKVASIATYDCYEPF